MAFRYKQRSNSSSSGNNDKNTAQLILFTFFNTYLFLALRGLSPDSVIAVYTLISCSACQWLVHGCPTPKNVFSQYGKVKIYELSKMSYFYVVNPEAELFNPL